MAVVVVTAAVKSDGVVVVVVDIVVVVVAISVTLDVVTLAGNVSVVVVKSPAIMALLLCRRCYVNYW